jgi:tRNA threonylcarbamoyladenosine biosynthesis protein TsaE
MATCISHSVADTEALGENWGRGAENGLVIGLSGDLGAGKTQLVKGLARGLGVTARVHSPTFSLVNEYGGGRLKLFHLDLYRLDTREQIAAAGLEQYFNPAGVTVIEWPERWFGRKPEVKGRTFEVGSQRSEGECPASRLRWVRIEVLSETQRGITYEDFGA